jgi:O-antigen/teichoic acid export membrane protein
MNKKYKRLIGDMGIFALGALGSKLVLFLLLPIYTHVLTDSEYGIADLIFTIGDLLMPFVSLAIFNGLLRYGLINGKKNNSLLCASIVFVCGSIISVFVTPLVGLYRPISDWKWYVCAYVIAHFARSNSLVYLKVKNKNKLYSILSIVQALALVGCNVLLLIVFKLGIQGYLLSTIVSNALLSVMAFILGGTWKDLKAATFEKPLLKEMMVYSFPFIFNDVSWWIIHSSDKIMIEWMIGGAMLGIYTAASKIPSLINVVTSIFSQAWGLASIKEYDSSNDTGFYSNVFNYFSIVIYGAAIFIIAITKPFMSFYVGKAFAESWHFVPLLLVSAVFLAIANYTGSLYGALKKSRYIMTTSNIASVVNIILNYVFIKMVGVYGAVIGTVSAYFIVSFLRVIDLRKRMGVDFKLKRTVILTILVLVQAIMVGFDFHVYIVSIVAIVLYLIVTKNDLISIGRIISKRLKSMR